MTLRQQLLQIVYPLFRKFSSLSSNVNKIKTNEKNIIPKVSFYSLKTTLNNGTAFSFENLKGYKVLIVNTASDCGFTGQYEELEKLHQQYQNTLKIIAFPANDFKEQEKATDDAIAQFCKINYGISFTLMKKTKVIGNNPNEVFKWLSNEQHNGWCNQQPVWNFCKYLINEEGKLTHFFGPAIAPTSSSIINEIQH